MSDYTPIMKQYMEIKDKHKDKIIFFRMGDFYEMFFEDAIECSKILLLTLTSRGTYKENKIPMCGFPYNSLDYYIVQLLKNGKHIAICEQISTSKKNGLIERKVLNIFTPGTYIENTYLKDNINNYIACIYFNNFKYGIACLDISLGHFFINQVNNFNELQDELDRIEPIELIISESMKDLTNSFKNTYIQIINDNKFDYNKALIILTKHFNQQFNTDSLSTLRTAITAGGYLLKYIFEIKNKYIKNIICIDIYNLFDLLYVDKNTRKSLEIFKSSTGNENDSLFATINLTQTTIGKKMLKRWISTPMLSSNNILKKRTKAITILKENFTIITNLKKKLKKVDNLEKILFNLSRNAIKPNELLKLGYSLNIFKDLKDILSILCYDNMLKDIHDNIKTFPDIIELINHAILDIPSSNVKDGNVIKSTFDKKINFYRTEIKNIDNYIEIFQKKERDHTKISSLKVLLGKNGYFIEASTKKKVPDNYKKIKDLSITTRYTNDELQKIELNFKKYSDNLLIREIKIYNFICYKLRKHIQNIQNSIKYIAMLDVLRALAEVSSKYSWTEPSLVDYNVINIKSGRHPVVESNGLSTFIPNDTILDTNNKIYVITGPNMGGKSTYMRQVAIITLLAHIGAHVPADKAIIGGIDKIFTRIGANDDISNFSSTFMLEMTELSNILNSCTERSLVIIDEIGRGTNHLEGKSIAFSILSEFILNKKSFLLFATHFYEISHITGLYKNVRSIYFKVLVKNEKLIFLYKYFNGYCNKGFAFDVAKMAGIKNHIIRNSKYYLLNFKMYNQNYNRKYDQNKLLKRNEILLLNILKNFYMLKFFLKE